MGHGSHRNGVKNHREEIREADLPVFCRLSDQYTASSFSTARRFLISGMGSSASSALVRKSKPATTPPMLGTSKKSQTWRERFAADEDRRAKAARGVHADTGDVNAEDVNDHKRDADAQSGKSGGSGLLCRAKNHHHKNEGCHELKDDGRDQVVFALVAWPPAILSQAVGCDVVAAGHAADDEEREHPGGEDCAGELPDPIADHLGRLHATGGPHAQAYGRD